jgi:hypothetical protein
MTPWQVFYQSVQDPSWPKCATEQDFAQLPQHIQTECIEHGYRPGEYASQSALAHRVFPIKTDTACQLKWNWSTVFLTMETTASCHRTDHHLFDLEEFDFHNTPVKIQDRERMLAGQWPESGCNYCRKIEESGGQSDRITNLDFPGIHAPPELDQNPTATRVTPRMLEVYFDNTCNLKCVYCGPFFSSLWAAEIQRHGEFEFKGNRLFNIFNKSSKIESNKQKLFEWLKVHGRSLTNFNVLGGEPLFQAEFDQCLALFDQYPAPDLDLQIFSNLNVDHGRIQDLIAKTRDMIDRGRIKNFTVTASLDCWGPSQEYVRYPLDLVKWERNFLLLLEQPWIKLIVGSTITPLTIGTLDQLIEKINQWRKIRPIYHYFNSVTQPSYMFIDIFGDLFRSNFDRCLALIDDSEEFAQVKRYLDGIAKQSQSKQANLAEVEKLQAVLDELDCRRNTDWRKTFPWLVAAVDQKTG